MFVTVVNAFGEARLIQPAPNRELGAEQATTQDSSSRVLVAARSSSSLEMQLLRNLIRPSIDLVPVTQVSKSATEALV